MGGDDLHTASLGLLLDVDGPIASPVTRTISIPAIADDLVRLANAGIPIVFNTGRSDAFLRERVLPSSSSAASRPTPASCASARRAPCGSRSTTAAPPSRSSTSRSRSRRRWPAISSG
ncbi:hypothetical protein [Rathayibacter oskolensis]|uniref:hypothetical protein n=1 Tax=Rathayibacter oskolensis TaxID=1891671 RepID=UPI0034654EED